MVFTGVLAVHLTVMLVDFFFIRKPLIINLDGDFVGSAFSFPMVPIIAAYFIFSLALLYLWNKMKKAILTARESERQHERQKMLLGILQEITGILGQHITAHNSEIQRWLTGIKMKNRQPPKAVEDSSRRISEVLGALSEIAFLAGRDQPSPDEQEITDIHDIESLLTRRIIEKGAKAIAADAIRRAGKVH